MQGPIGAANAVLLALALYGFVSAGMVLFRLVRRLTTRDPVGPVSLLVLVQNQAEHIEAFLRTAAGMMRERPPRGCRPGELLVVDLASIDQTPAILERLSRQEPALRLVRIPAERVAEALETSFFLCRGTVAVMVDMRGKVDPRALLRTLTTIW